jgi:hypothetical protein
VARANAVRDGAAALAEEQAAVAALLARRFALLEVVAARVAAGVGAGGAGGAGGADADRDDSIATARARLRRQGERPTTAGEEAAEEAGGGEEDCGDSVAAEVVAEGAINEVFACVSARGKATITRRRARAERLRRRLGRPR